MTGGRDDSTARELIRDTERLSVGVPSSSSNSALSQWPRDTLPERARMVMFEASPQRNIYPQRLRIGIERAAAHPLS